jgi:hypothetical protein
MNDCEAFAYFFEQSKHQNLRSFYGGESYFFRLARCIPDYEDLCLKLSELHRDGVSYLGPLATLRWIIQQMKMRKSIDVNLFSRCFINCLEMSDLQRRYLQAVLSVSEAITQFKCRFTGMPLVELDIRFENGVIFAEDNLGRRNTLLAHSRYSGELVTISSHEVCQDVGNNKTCACLISNHKGKIVGKKTCPEFGEARDKSVREYFAQRETLDF